MIVIFFIMFLFKTATSLQFSISRVLLRRSLKHTNWVQMWQDRRQNMTQQIYQIESCSSFLRTSTTICKQSWSLTMVATMICYIKADSLGSNLCIHICSHYFSWFLMFSIIYSTQKKDKHNFHPRLQGLGNSAPPKPCRVSKARGQRAVGASNGPRSRSSKQNRKVRWATKGVFLQNY